MATNYTIPVVMFRAWLGPKAAAWAWLAGPWPDKMAGRALPSSLGSAQAQLGSGFGLMAFSLLP